MYHLYSLIKLANDFDDTKPIAVMFAANQTKRIIEIPVKCDKRSETNETFAIGLKLISNIPQVRTTKDRAVGVIRDITGRL